MKTEMQTNSTDTAASGTKNTLRTVAIFGGIVCLAFVIFMFGILLLGITVAGGYATMNQIKQGQQSSASSTGPAVHPADIAPMGEMASMVQPMQRIATQDADAARVASDLYRSLGDVIHREIVSGEGAKIKTTAVVKAWITDAEYLEFQNTSAVGKLTGFKDAQFRVIAFAIGDDEAVLTPQKRLRLEEALYAISWAMANP